MLKGDNLLVRYFFIVTKDLLEASKLDRVLLNSKKPRNQTSYTRGCTCCISRLQHKWWPQLFGCSRITELLESIQIEERRNGRRTTAGCTTQKIPVVYFFAPTEYNKSSHAPSTSLWIATWTCRNRKWKDGATSLLFLQTAKMLPTESLCPGKYRSPCGFQMIQKKRILHCQKKKCRKKLSVAHCNTFLFRTRLYLWQILETIWLFLYSNATIRQIQDITG